MLTRLDAWLRGITLAGIGAGLLTPVVYAPVTQDPFIFLKVAWLQAAVGLSFPAYLILAWRRPELRPPRTWVVFALLAQAATVVLAFAFADERSHDFWGTSDRMDGVWPLLHFVAWSLMVGGIVRTWQGWRRLLQIVVGMGLAAGCVVLLQLRFPGILGPQTDIRLSGLFGNPIFSAAFHLFVIFLVALLWSYDRTPSSRLKALYVLATLVSLAAVVLSGSRGATLGLATGFAGVAVVFGLLGRRWKAVVVAVAGIAAVGALYLAVAKLVVPLPQLQSFWAHHYNLQRLFSAEGNGERIDHWRLALMGIRDHPLFGWGPVSFESINDRHYIPLQHCEAKFGFDNAHNIVLQALATTGVVGLAGLLFLWGAVFAAVVRAHRRGELERLPAASITGLAASYLTQAMFNPEAPGTRLLCYLLFALAMWLWRPSCEPPPQPHAKPGFLAFAVVELTGIVIVTAWTLLPAYASELTRSTSVAFQQGRLTEAWGFARRGATVLTPYLDKQLLVNQRLLLRLAESPAPEHAALWRDLLAVNRDLARRCFAYHTTPRLRMLQAVILHSVAASKGDGSLYKESEQELRNAMRDNPMRRDIAFALAGIWTEQGRLDEAEDLYRKTVNDEPEIGESQFRLGSFLWISRSKVDEGAPFLERSLRSQCSYPGADMGELALIATAYDRVGDRDGLKSLISAAGIIRASQSPRDYAVVAGFLQKAGLSEERDTVLRLAMKQFPNLVEDPSPAPHPQ